MATGVGTATEQIISAGQRTAEKGYMCSAEQQPQRNFSLKEMGVEKGFTTFKSPRGGAAGFIEGNKYKSHAS
jgi:hypothetical protein